MHVFLRARMHAPTTKELRNELRGASQKPWRLASVQQDKHCQTEIGNFSEIVTSCCQHDAVLSYHQTLTRQGLSRRPSSNGISLLFGSCAAIDARQMIRDHSAAG